MEAALGEPLLKKLRVDYYITKAWESGMGMRIVPMAKARA